MTHLAQRLGDGVGTRSERLPVQASGHFLDDAINLQCLQTGVRFETAGPGTMQAAGAAGEIHRQRGIVRGKKCEAQTRVCRAKGTDDGRADRRSHMHGSRVIRQQGLTALDCSGQQ